MAIKRGAITTNRGVPFILLFGSNIFRTKVREFIKVFSTLWIFKKIRKKDTRSKGALGFDGPFFFATLAERLIL
jgi:hypothetical protein